MQMEVTLDIEWFCKPNTSGCMDLDCNHGGLPLIITSFCPSSFVNEVEYDSGTSLEKPNSVSKLK